MVRACIVAFFTALLVVVGFFASAATPDQMRIEAMQRLADGRYAEAEPILERLLARQPSAANTYFLGLCRLKRWKLDSAASLLEAATSAEPDRHEWLHTLAECNLERGRCDLSIAALDRAIAIAPMPRYFYDRAMCELNLGRVADAERDLRTLLEKTPDHAPARTRLAALLVASGREDEAATWLEPVVANADADEARYLLARILAERGEDRRAEDLFSAVLEQTPGHSGALYGLGRLLMRTGRVEEGRVLLQRFEDARKVQEEIENLRDYVAANPTDAATRLRLAKALAAHGERRTAIQELEVVRRTAADDPGIYRRLADEFRRLGRIEDARRAADRAVELEKKDPE